MSFDNQFAHNVTAFRLPKVIISSVTFGDVWPFYYRLWENSIQSLILYSTISLLVCAVLILLFTRAFSPQLRFFWYCFIRPFSTEDQKTRLDEVCLTLQYPSSMMLTTLLSSTADRQRYTTQRVMYFFVAVILCWVFQLPTYATSEKLAPRSDLSGSTLVEERVGPIFMNLIWLLILPLGHNIELMNKYYPIASFDAIYVVDLCEPLLNVATRRFKERGWTNVHVLCQDATEFFLPEWSNGTDPKGSLSFVTLSYSLSMVCLFCPYFWKSMLDLDYRFQTTMQFWTESNIFYHLTMDFWALWTSILPRKTHLFIKEQLVVLAKSACGCPDGSGKYGLILIM